ncbi:hypothetical protein OH77DRAFT_1309934 [Trametes cingulata]|nr:hypothetical protein OH77DRAFT_1309934 [Trametes cingulata]
MRRTLVFGQAVMVVDVRHEWKARPRRVASRLARAPPRAAQSSPPSAAPRKTHFAFRQQRSLRPCPPPLLDDVVDCGDILLDIFTLFLGLSGL